MRIAYFTESLPPLTDGVARTYTRLAETLNHKGLDFLFIAPKLPAEKEPWRGRVVWVPSVPFPLYRYYRLGIPYPPKLDKVLDRFKPDLVQVGAPTGLCLYGQNYAMRRNLPTVASYHTHFVDYFPYYGLRWAESLGWKWMKWFYNRNKLTFAPTPGTVRELKNRGFKNVRLWSRGVDRRKFSPQFRRDRLRKKLGGKDPLLLFVGRMVSEKNLEVLSDAAVLLRAKGHKFQLVFAGDGPYRSVLEKKLPQDHYLGFVQGRDLAELYASSDLFVFPSTTETFGNVILEAFSSGLPVIAANQGGSADLVHSGVNGYLSKPKNPHDFASKIEPLLLRQRLREHLSKGALETAASYDWLEINGKLLETCRELAEKNNNSIPANLKTTNGKFNKKLGWDKQWEQAVKPFLFPTR